MRIAGGPIGIKVEGCVLVEWSLSVGAKFEAATKLSQQCELKYYEPNEASQGGGQPSSLQWPDQKGQGKD